MPRRTTAYGRVADAIREQIADGTLQPGDRIGSLSGLQEEFGVSDTVILEARKVLVAEGLLQPRPGDGTYVRERPVPQRLVRNESYEPGEPPFRLEQGESGLFPDVMEESARVGVPAGVARHLGIQSTRKVTRTRRVFRHEGSAVQLVTVYAANATDAKSPASSSEEEVSARPALDAEARALGGVAGHLVTTATLTEHGPSRPLRVVETVVLTERYTLVYRPSGPPTRSC
ncbi:GntR family transcriptional regulator [Streptomyces sp. NPDC001404]|uniref:GntR family transcriptional regulator n=1 Tax=Streptomyces sp. NPDC001404 TaxID=3364571 RepID=UPI0036BFF22D